jgi:hypothetical protein
MRNDLREIVHIISETNRISLLSIPTNGYLTSGVQYIRVIVRVPIVIAVPLMV